MAEHTGIARRAVEEKTQRDKCPYYFHCSHTGDLFSLLTSTLRGVESLLRVKTLLVFGSVQERNEKVRQLVTFALVLQIHTSPDLMYSLCQAHHPYNLTIL